MYAAVGVPAVDDVGIERVRRDVAALAGAHRRPVAEGDRAEVAATRHAGGARILLSAVHAVGEGVVRDHVVELGRRLLVPAAPAAAAVERDHRALVAAHDHARRARGIDPQLMIVVPAWLSLEDAERLAAVRGLEERHVGHVDDVGVPGIHGDAAEVPVAVGEPRIAPRELPGRAAARSMAPVSGSLYSTLVHVRPPSVERNTPRSLLGPYACPSAATRTTSGFRGSTSTFPMWRVSARPSARQCAPPSVDL